MIQTTIEIVALEQEAKIIGQSLKKDVGFIIDMVQAHGCFRDIRWEDFDKKKWMVYQGGHHISLHARYADGALGKRLVMFIDSTCCEMCKEIVK